jgi:hypothetical protein
MANMRHKFTLVFASLESQGLWASTQRYGGWTPLHRQLPPYGAWGAGIGIWSACGRAVIEAIEACCVQYHAESCVGEGFQFLLYA